MGSSGVQVSHGWLDTIKALLFPCSDSKDPRSESVSGVFGTHPMDDSLMRREALNRQGLPEKNYYQVYYDQPAPMPPPRAQRQRSLSMGKVRKESKRAAAKQGDIGWIDRNFRSGKRKAPRPMISNPFDFQHTGTGAVNFMTSTADLPRSAPPFRPLELSIYQADEQISPLLPYFTQNTAPSPPQRALTRDTFDEDASTLAHSRSYSSQSFHIPRRPVNDVASFTTATSSTGDSPPRIPPRARTRPRAYTSPSVEAIVERIASAMIEKEKLDMEIESVKERQSFCLSRPSSIYGVAEDEEPMPPVPLMPPSGPSFAERLSIDRPRTAPSTRSTFDINPPFPPPPPPRNQHRSQSIDEPRAQQEPPSAPPRPVPESAFNSHPPWCSPQIIDNSVNISVPLAPPLPLILRPPLRKKKSFSRVSSWLFPAGVEDREQVPSPQHRREVSLDSVTNAPRALTDRDGFYQTLPPSAVFSGRRSSFGSMSDITRSQTHSVYSTDEDPFIGPGTTTATSNWSPGSTPPEAARRKDSASTSGYMSGHSASLSLSRTGTFGSRERPVDGVAVQGPRPTSVGVAF
ncbi:hypothetical protein J7T55_004746 [Diaporthe amygdali]|uniref:uncharacterized protein n=1 Tax=Phomopsis amygdali TaxID=1214568 RepID=UPI0022FEE270|nr:uncharacterized protein J7T55_004746 [Diaporthe amygdali]KAJ0114503.1 hypothetical protein J7T55_004746 [Diaporthe amygdali]